MFGIFKTEREGRDESKTLHPFKLKFFRGEENGLRSSPFIKLNERCNLERDGHKK